MKRFILFVIVAFSALFFGMCANPANWDWVSGDWVRDSPSTPWSIVYSFDGGGTLFVYSDYAKKSLIQTTSYSLNENIVTITGNTTPVFRVTVNQFIDTRNSWYRLGTEPLGNICGPSNTIELLQAQPEASLLVQTADYRVYKFETKAGNLYVVNWQDSPGIYSTSQYTANVMVSAFKSDLSPYFTDKTDENSNPEYFTAEADGLIYIVVRINPASIQTGTFSIEVK